MQITSESEFPKWLLAIGNNEIDEFVPSEDMISTDLVEDMYNENMTPEEMSKVAILASRNDEVNELNGRILSKLPGEATVCCSIDSAQALGTDLTETSNEQVQLSFPPEYLNSLTPSGLPPHKLHLKKGAIVMLLRNLCISDGLCNGTRLIVRLIGQKILCCEILTGEKAGNIVCIPRIVLDTCGDPDMPFTLKRLQFPVRLAFAMTINKSQGQSFDRIGLYIDASRQLFTHGQLYVAVSRCPSNSGIRIQIRN